MADAIIHLGRKSRAGRWLCLLAGVAAIAAMLGAGMHSVPWFGRFLGSRLSVIGGLSAIGSGIVLWGLVGVMRRLGEGRRRPGSQEGTAVVEFAMVFPVAMSVVLILIQSMLLMAGNLAVNAAAYAAARSAIVWTGENLLDEPRNVVLSDGQKMREHIRMAAVFTVLPVSADKSIAAGEGVSSVAMSDGLTEFFQKSGQAVPNWIRTKLAAKYNYANDEANTQVTLSPPADPNANGGGYASHEDLEVQVRHRLYLSVPYANRLFGEAAGTEGDYAAAAAASFALPNEGVPDQITEPEDPNSPFRSDKRVLTGG